MWDIGYRYRAYIVRCVSILFSILYKIQEARRLEPEPIDRNMEHGTSYMLHVGRWTY